MPDLGREAVNESRLSGQDLSFLAWESERRPMHIAVRADFRAPPGRTAPTLAELRKLLGGRVRSEPRLMSRLRRRRLRAPVWEPAPELRIERHVQLAFSEGARGASLDEILRAPLDPNLPLWEVWLVPSAADRGAFSLIVKIHHVLIDGIAGVALLERLLGGSGRVPGTRRAARARRRRSSLPSILRFLRDQFRGSQRTSLNGEVAPRRHHVLEVEADEFDAAAVRMGGTRNDLVLASVTGAIQRWLSRKVEGPLPALRAFCPVNLRSRGDRTFGNRIAPWFVPLPVREPDVAGRVAQIHETTRALKRRAAQRGGDGMARVIEWLGPWVSRLGMAIAARRRAFNIVVTNVPGPQPIELLGARLTRLVPFAPLFPGQRVSVAVLEYDGRLFWGVAHGWVGSGRGDRFVGDLATVLEELRPARAADGAAA